VLSAALVGMHRQIAGKLTSPVTKWVVAGVWVVLTVVGWSFGSKLSQVTDDQASSWVPSSAESTKALNKLDAFQSPNDIPMVIVYSRSGGLTADDVAAIKAQVPSLQAMHGVSKPVQPPQLSSDRVVAQTVVTYNLGTSGWNKLPDTVDQLDKLTAIDGVTVHYAGPGGQASDSAQAFAGLDSTLLLASLGVVILILLFTYRSPILWVLPILSAVSALGVSEGIIYFLAKDAGLTVNSQSSAILTVLVIGAGTDYALLLVARYREELRRHDDRHEAMAFALHRATPAIIASASTVAIGMLCLMFAEMNSTAGLGPVNAIGVVVTLVVMTTFLPALLVIFGRWMFWPKRPTYGSAEPTATGVWAKVGRGIAPRPRLVWVVTALILGAAALYSTQLDARGLTTADQYTKHVGSTEGQALLTEHGLVDDSSPIQVVADSSATARVAEAIQSVPGLGNPDTTTPPIDGVALISVTTPDDVASQAAFDKVREVRDAVHRVSGADALVGGASATYLDVQTASHRDNKVIIPIILVVVFVILMLLLRALVSPLLLMLTVVLSYGAALGISTFIFQHLYVHVFENGDGFHYSDPSFPLFVFVFLVALGIDYNIFLMTRVREETLVRGTRQGSLVALSATGGVITSAGLVLAATFAVLGTLPLVFIAEIGTAVALGVILDTIVVRSVLVTALNLDIGGKIWWPSRLDKGQELSSADAAQKVDALD
jgi:putative drug exporter of the RND superfamily